MTTPATSAPAINTQYTGTLTALAPIAHGQGNMGIVQILNTIKLVVGGRVIDLPLISGNAMRGVLRDYAMYYLCDALGLSDLSVSAVHTLFSGGALAKGSSKKGVDLALQRELVQRVPPLSLFGAAFGNFIMESPLKVGAVIPICAETVQVGLVPDEYRDHPQAALSCYDLRDTIMLTRRDDAKRPRVQALLTAPDREALEQRLLLQAAAKADNKAKDPEDQSQQMRYGAQVFAAGTVFYHSLALVAATEMQEMALRSALAVWALNPVIGGMSARGLGVVRPEYQQVSFMAGGGPAHALMPGTALDAYRAYLTANAEYITDFVRSIT